MGVYIKGMEMPGGCGDCPCNIYGDCDAVTPRKQKYRWSGDTRPDWCPLVEIPPHGRLIDADALMETIRAHDYPLKSHFNSTDNGMFTLGIQQAVDEAPAIIPAEEGKT